MSKFIHSYFSRPYLSKDNRWQLQNEHFTALWLFALSMEYVHQSNHEIVLFTDDYGKTLFDGLGYDKLFTDLNQLQNLNFHERFWAAGKVIALQNSPVGDVHIDGDVFLKNEKLCRDILNADCDLIVQNSEYAFIEEHEDLHTIYWHTYTLLEKIMSDFQSIVEKHRWGLCCGIVGLKKAELKDKFCVGYFENLRKIHKYDLELLSQCSSPDLIFEQLYLYQCVKETNAKIELLLGNGWDENSDKKATEKGYCHLIAGAKTTELQKVKDRLMELNPELYNKVLQLTISS